MSTRRTRPPRYPFSATYQTAHGGRKLEVFETAEQFERWMATSQDAPYVTSYSVPDGYTKRF